MLQFDLTEFRYIMVTNHNTVVQIMCFHSVCENFGTPLLQIVTQESRSCVTFRSYRILVHLLRIVSRMKFRSCVPFDITEFRHIFMKNYSTGVQIISYHSILENYIIFLLPILTKLSPDHML